MPAEQLSILMQGSFSEIYVIDCDTMHFIDVNETACKSLQYSVDELAGMTPLSIAADAARPALKQLLTSLCRGKLTQAELDTRFVRRDGATYPLELRLFRAASGVRSSIVIIGNNASPRHELAEALRRSESRFRAIVSNTPGLVYQFLLKADGSTSFPYLSEGCHALLGITAHGLHAEPTLFVDLILPEDRLSYRESMSASAADMSAWNWEGRLWIDEWKDTKWINLRASPRALPDGGLQWEGIMTNITASKLEQAQIKRSRAQLVELSAHVETVKEKERTRIAREIHDDVGGNLTAIKMALSMLARRLPSSDTALVEKAAYVDSLIDRTFEAVHRIAGDLRPSILDCGIVEAIDWQAKEYEKQSGIPCEFHFNRSEIELSPDQATTLFRILQEALSNISKHAQASHVSVELERRPHSVRLEVVDNGRGIVPADRLKPKSFGLHGMAERAAALGGQLSISGPAGGGTVVAIDIPL